MSVREQFRKLRAADWEYALQVGVPTRQMYFRSEGRHPFMGPIRFDGHADLMAFVALVIKGEVPWHDLVAAAAAADTACVWWPYMDALVSDRTIH